MPNWNPNWQDVRWDHDAAHDAMTALRNAADLLDRTADDRTRVASEATQEWQGRYRVEFDGLLTQMLRRARELAGQYRDAANRIGHASQRANEEQRRRDRERHRWRLEKEAEDRARRRREQQSW